MATPLIPPPPPSTNTSVIMFLEAPRESLEKNNYNFQRNMSKMKTLLHERP